MRATAKTQKEFILTPAQYRRLKDLGYKAIPATIHQTFGPNWRHLFFVSRDGGKKQRGMVHYYDVDMKPEKLYQIATQEPETASGLLDKIKNHPAVQSVDPNPGEVFVNLKKGWEWSGQRSFGCETMSETWRLLKSVSKSETAMSMEAIVEQVLNPTKFDPNTLFETASSGLNSKPVEMHKREVKGRLLDVQKWMPMIAPTYEISANINDYVVAPVILFPTDIPNRNSVAFPLEEIIKWNPRQGRPNFKTWVGKPTFREHANHDYRQSKGVVLDTFITPIQNTVGNLHKVIALVGYDRSKDSELANSILKGERDCYSMGAWVKTYECSICGMHSEPGKLNTACGHVKRGKPVLFEAAKGRMIPSYLMARYEIEGFEVSSVGYPAWSSAKNSDLFDMARY